MSDFSTFEALELAGWQERAADYDNFTLRMTGATIPSLLAAAGLQPGQRVLDVCCGTGEVASQAAAIGASVDGLDFASHMIDRARRKVPQARFTMGDAQELPYGEATFDTVLTNFGHYHLPDPDRAIAEAARVLKPGGTYGFTTWVGPDASEGFRLIFETVLSNIDPDVKLPMAPDPFRLADPVIATRVMAVAGFSNVSVTTFPSTITCSPDAFVTFLKAATVRATMVLKAQPETTRQRIEALLLERVQRFLVDGQVVLPVPNRIITGFRTAGRVPDARGRPCRSP